MKTTLLVAATLGSATLLTASAVEPFVLRSGPGQTALIELFSSEGCSSCPPAEKWLGGLAAEAGLWREFVPVAFHVDYWDGLGWPDRFASPENTRRQESYSANWRSPSIYTPGFVLNGREWRNWRGTLTLGTLLKAETGVLEVTSAHTNQFTLTFKPAAGTAGEFEATVAWLGSNLVTDVRRGENAGRQLRHNFVLLRSFTTRLKRTEDQAAATVTLSHPDPRDSEKLAVAAWVMRRGEPAPLQAAGGWWKD
ncbi:MAG TPA: DUF1223 domain-containing protein [Candidatus Limnocylindria bacterium]|jgi:hypothetical protein|nr:DUF1223 domain-containing protein [Candidatus Limnocylindria bacterium]